MSEKDKNTSAEARQSSLAKLASGAAELAANAAASGSFLSALMRPISFPITKPAVPKVPLVFAKPPDNAKIPGVLPRFGISSALYGTGVKPGDYKFNSGRSVFIPKPQPAQQQGPELVRYMTPDYQEEYKNLSAESKKILEWVSDKFKIRYWKKSNGLSNATALKVFRLISFVRDMQLYAPWLHTCTSVVVEKIPNCETDAYLDAMVEVVNRFGQHEIPFRVIKLTCTLRVVAHGEVKSIKFIQCGDDRKDWITAQGEYSMKCRVAPCLSDSALDILVLFTNLPTVTIVMDAFKRNLRFDKYLVYLWKNEDPEVIHGYIFAHIDSTAKDEESLTETPVKREELLAISTHLINRDLDAELEGEILPGTGTGKRRKMTKEEKRPGNARRQREWRERRRIAAEQAAELAAAQNPLLANEPKEPKKPRKPKEGVAPKQVGIKLGPKVRVVEQKEATESGSEGFEVTTHGRDNGSSGSEVEYSRKGVRITVDPGSPKSLRVRKEARKEPSSSSDSDSDEAPKAVPKPAAMAAPKPAAEEEEEAILID